MDTMMKFLVVGMLVLASCKDQRSPSVNSNSTSTTSLKQSIGKLNGFLKKYEEPSQFFKVPADKPSRVEGKNGTVIFIDPKDLTGENGSIPGKTLDVELKELVGQEQLLKNNVHTVAKDQLMVSGGVYYLQVTSEGSPVTLKEGKTLKVIFPEFDINEMSLFYGQRDSLGQMSWLQSIETFQSAPSAKRVATTGTPAPGGAYSKAVLLFHEQGESQPVATKKQGEKHKKPARNLYAPLQVKSLGWLHCARFLNIINIENKTNLEVRFNPADSISAANIYLVFKDINSIMQYYHYNGTNYNGTNYDNGFNNIPIGYKARLIVYAFKGDVLSAYKTDFTIKDKHKITPNMQETTAEALSEMFENHTWSEIIPGN